jgi:hypothetical protein
MIHVKIGVCIDLPSCGPPCCVDCDLDLNLELDTDVDTAEPSPDRQGKCRTTSCRSAIFCTHTYWPVTPETVALRRDLQTATEVKGVDGSSDVGASTANYESWSCWCTSYVGV